MQVQRLDPLLVSPQQAVPAVSAAFVAVLPYQSLGMFRLLPPMSLCRYARYRTKKKANWPAVALSGLGKRAP